MKYFLLIAGDCYYPTSGAGDQIDCFETLEEAKAEVKIQETPKYFSSGKNMGQIKDVYIEYFINKRRYDWYDIVDLRDWMISYGK